MFDSDILDEKWGNTKRHKFNSLTLLMRGFVGFEGTIWLYNEFFFCILIIIIKLRTILLAWVVMNCYRFIALELLRPLVIY